MELKLSVYPWFVATVIYAIAGVYTYSPRVLGYPLAHILGILSPIYHYSRPFIPTVPFTVMLCCIALGSILLTWPILFYRSQIPAIHIASIIFILLPNACRPFVASTCVPYGDTSGSNTFLVLIGPFIAAWITLNAVDLLMKKLNITAVAASISLVFVPLNFIISNFLYLSAYLFIDFSFIIMKIVPFIAVYHLIKIYFSIRRSNLITVRG